MNALIFTYLQISCFCFRNCGDMGSGVCKDSGERILYAWGRNAPVLKLPKGKAGK